MSTNAENVAKNLSCSRSWEPLTKESVVRNAARRNQLNSFQCLHHQVPAALSARAASAPPVKSLQSDSLIALFIFKTGQNFESIIGAMPQDALEEKIKINL